jgi:hypothetical protein
VQPHLADRAAVERLLFDAFIPAIYRHDHAGRKARAAEKWLVFLARHLERTIARPDLAWWQLPAAVPGFAFVVWVVASIVVGIVAGVVAGIVAGAAAGIVAGVMAGVAVGFDAYSAGELFGGSERVRRFLAGGLGRDPAEGLLALGILAGSWASMGTAMGTGLVTGFLVWLKEGVNTGLVAGFVAALAAGFLASVGISALGLLRMRARGSVTSPSAVLARERRLAIEAGVVAGLAAGLAAGFVAGFVAGLGTGVLAGLVAGFVAGVGASFSGAWPSYEIARIWLALGRRLPWSLIGFLVDAHRRGVLRQAGAVYQFRHIELQHRLANRDASREEVSSPATPSAADA